MGYRVSGILKLPDGTPGTNCEIEFASRKNFTPVLTGMGVSIRTDSAGAYDVTLEYGAYAVILRTGNTYPTAIGQIIVAPDTVVGQDLPTLLEQSGWQPATPEYIQQITKWMDRAESAATRSEASAVKSADDGAAQAALAKSQADRAKSEADRASKISGLETVADAIGLAALPMPDVSIPFSTDGRMTRGKGTPVLVGTTPVAQLVSYERLGSQAMLDKSGRLVTVPAGEMAIEQQGLAIFDQSVNSAAPSINWAASANAATPWVHGAKDEFGWISVSGSGDPSKTEGSYKDFPVPTAGSPHTLSLDILKVSGLNVKLRGYGTATGTTVDIVITETAVSGYGASDVYDMGHYWRVELTRTFTGTTRLFRIYPFGPNIGSAGAMSYRRVQLESKPFATPYIENETSAQTARPATTRCDIPWRENMQPISDNQQVTIALEFDVAGTPPSYFTIFNQGSGAQNFIARVNSELKLLVYRPAGTTHQQQVAARRKYRMCYRVNKNVVDLFLDGVKVGGSITASPSAPGVPDILRLGYITSQDRCLNGHLRSIAIWNAPLTDIQCQAASAP